MESTERLEAAIRSAIEEERGYRGPRDEGHQWPSAESIARSPSALEVAERLDASIDPAERAVAAHVLAAMVGEAPARAAEATRLLARMMERPGDVHLEWALADALRLSWHPGAVASLLRLEGSASDGVRRAVAEGLGSAMSGQPDGAGVAALVRLSADPRAIVRDWATFSLGSQIDLDTPVVRAALWARAGDPHYDTRCEALLGLARRRDGAAAPRIAAELRAARVGRLVVEAAAEAGDPLLSEPLAALRPWWNVDPALLERAIEACARDEAVKPGVSPVSEGPPCR